MPMSATKLERPEVSLPPAQLQVLGHLLAGETVTAAAGAGGVDRSTVHRWLKVDFAFQAALNQGKRELRDAAQSLLNKSATKAAETVAHAVDQGDLKAALVLLKGLGILSGSGAAFGPDDSDVLRQESEVAQEEAELARSERAHERMLRQKKAEVAQEEAELAWKEDEHQPMLRRLMYPG